MIVVDSNVLAARNLTGIRTLLAEQLEARDPFWIVPRLWRYEFQNILAKAIWARQITSEDAAFAWRNTFGKMSENEHDPDPAKLIELSARYRITAYDANFIALAMEMGVLCVTEDAELQQKFPSLALSMDAFLKQNVPDVGVREPRALYRTRKR